MQQKIVIEDMNKYCLAWVDSNTHKYGKGTFLFNEPQEAKTTIEQVQQQFPSYLIWLEDRESNKIEVGDAS